MLKSMTVFFKQQKNSGEGVSSPLFSDEEKEIYQKEISPDKRDFALRLRDEVMSFATAVQNESSAAFIAEAIVRRGFLG